MVPDRADHLRWGHRLPGFWCSRAFQPRPHHTCHPRDVADRRLHAAPTSSGRIVARTLRHGFHAAVHLFHIRRAHSRDPSSL